MRRFGIGDAEMELLLAALQVCIGFTCICIGVSFEQWLCCDICVDCILEVLIYVAISF